MSMIQQTPKYSLIFLLTLSLVLSLSNVVWAGDEAIKSTEPQSAEWTLGEIRKLDKSTGKLTIRHEEIKNLNMPAMTMVFTVKRKDMWGDLKVGDKIQFKALQEQGKLILIEMKSN